MRYSGTCWPAQLLCLCVRSRLRSKHAVLIVQVSKLTSSIRELSEKLLGCQRQHDHDSVTSESAIQQLTSKLNGVTSEAAVVKAALETAALENEASRNEIKQLKQDRDTRSREVATVWPPAVSLSCTITLHCLT